MPLDEFKKVVTFNVKTNFFPLVFLNKARTAIKYAGEIFIIFYIWNKPINFSFCIFLRKLELQRFFAGEKLYEKVLWFFNAWLKIFYNGNLRGLVFWLNCNLQFIANFGISNVNSYSPVRIRRGLSNRRGGSGKILKTLQEGGHFLMRGGSDKPKMLQEGGP